MRGYYVHLPVSKPYISRPDLIEYSHYTDQFIMKRITILAMLICILSGCVSSGLSELAPIITIGEVSISDGKLELTVSRGNNRVSTAELYAANDIGAARVPLHSEDIIKLRDMLDMALNLPPSSDTRDTSTAIGIIESYERTGLAFSAAQHNGERTFRMLAVGIYGIPRLHFNLSRDELKELNRLLGKAITELNKELPIIAPQEQPK